MISTEFITVGLICSVIGGIAGYLINNRLAIGRDRRREYNALVDPIRQTLLGMRINPGINLKGSWEITFFLIREKLPFWKRRGFDRAVKEYKKSKGDDNRKSDGMGGFFYKDTALIIHAANDLLKYLKPR